VSSKLGVDKTVELLESLRAVVADFKAREEKFEREFKIRMAKERQRHDESAVEQMAQLTTDIARAETDFERARQAAVTKFASRKAAIDKARKTSKEQALNRIEGKTGGRKYELQKRLIQTERNRDAGLASAVETLENYKVHIAGQRDLLTGLQDSARSAFRAYGFGGRLAKARQRAETTRSGDESTLLGELRELLKTVDADLRRFRRSILLNLFRFLPIWLLLPLCAVPAALQHYQVIALNQQTAVEISGGVAAFLLILFFVGRAGASPAANQIATGLGKADRLRELIQEKAGKRYEQELAQIDTAFKTGTQLIDQELKQTVKDDVRMKGSFREDVDTKTMRVLARNERINQSNLQRAEREHVEVTTRLKQQAVTREDDIARVWDEKEARFNAEYAAQWSAMEKEWNEKTRPIFEIIEVASAAAQKIFPPWKPEMVESWQPPQTFAHEAKFAALSVDLETFCEGLPKSQRLSLPGPPKFSVPLLLTYPDQGSIVFETTNYGHEDAINVLNNIVLRLLSVAPPGRLNFTVVDPVGLGQNFAGVMHLADYEERLINSKIWTQTAQIEQKLADLNEHMEKVIQMYLRNEYETIAEYNEAAGNIAEKYHFLVVADFPAGFSDMAIRRLASIVSSGARCGVYVLLHWNHRQPQPPDLVPEAIKKGSAGVSSRTNDFILTGRYMAGINLLLDVPATQDFAIAFIHKVGKASIDSSRVEVPFSHVAPPDTQIWSEDTTSELRVPIGRTGATKLQYVAIGKGTRQHALIAGKTGSGKSTLFHIMITNLALWCSPEQVEFYLVDFKKGVEFKCYASKHLPHARVVAIESDREFGLSVLQRLDDELKRRGDMFRKLGVQDIPGYKRAGGTEPMPRSLLLIDEFQEFFTEDDKISQTASVLLDRIVRQGRAFGIHVILGSQTLGGAYTVARATLGQMVIRIALQCNEADAYLIMDEGNPAPRLLSRPGEGIYNDAAGNIEGNSPFQAVWLSDQIRDQYLDKIAEKARQSGRTYPAAVVYEGDAPGDIRENTALQTFLAAPPAARPASARIWLGAPNSIKGPTEAVFHQQSGSHLLIVGQRDEAILATLSIALVSLAAQYPVGAAEFVVLDSSPPGSPPREYLERIIRMIPHKVTVATGGNFAEIMNGLAAEMKRRVGDEQAAGAPAVYLFIHGLQKFTKLRQEDDFSFSSGGDDAPANPAAQLNSLILEGGSLGFHVIATCDSYNNVNRFLGRKALSEFEMRILFQMSANDSASLIDNPKAGSLGLNRALLNNQAEGYLELFRPYALPGNDWIESASQSLSRSPK
jgi:S-DNA-T family DNA segregation ATPase FtsK/SpoIIIE